MSEEIINTPHLDEVVKYRNIYSFNKAKDELKDLKNEIRKLRQKIGKHYFTPSKEDSNFCNKCGKYFTDESHFRNL